MNTFLNEEFIEAVYNDQIELVSMLLEKGVDPSIQNNHAIHIATSQNYIDLVRILLNDPRVDPSINHNWDIREACMNGYTEIVKMLLNDSRVDPSDLDNEAIISTCCRGHTEIIKLLLKDSRVNPTARNNLTIIRATLWQNSDIVRLLLQDGRIDVGEFEDVFLACIDNDPNKIIELISNGVDPCAFDNMLIGWASKHGHANLVKILLKDLRVDPSAMKNFSIIHASHASGSHNINIVKKLLKDPRVDPGARDNQAIISACYAGKKEVVELLLKDHRVDPSVRNNKAIIFASRWGRESVVRLLLNDERVDPAAQKNLAVRNAAQNCRVDVVKLLLSDPRVDGSVAILCATSSVLKILIEDARCGFHNYESLYRACHSEFTEEYLRANREKEDMIFSSIWSMKQSKNQWKDILYIVGDILNHTDIIYDK